MILFRLSEQSFALPHSLGSILFELRLVHLSLNLLKEILIKRSKYESNVRHFRSGLGGTGREQGTAMAFARFGRIAFAIVIVARIRIEEFFGRTANTIVVMFVNQSNCRISRTRTM